MKILCLEPEFLTAESVAEQLRAEGHEVTYAGRAEKADKHVLSGEYDLVIFKPLMKGLNIPELIELLKSKGKPLPKFAICTAAAKNEESVTALLQAGIVRPEHVLEKPYSDDALLDLVKTIAQHHQTLVRKAAPNKILLTETRLDDADPTADFLRYHGYDVTVKLDRANAAHEIASGRYGLVITDAALQLDIPKLFQQLSTAGKPIPTCILTGASPLEELRNMPMVKAGIVHRDHVLDKPYKLDSLLPLVQKATGQSQRHV